jgi:hypothetical protein
MEYYARPFSRVRAPPVAILREKRTGLLQGIAELRWSYAHRPPKYLSKMARIARPFTRLKWNEAVDAPFLAPLLIRRKAFDCLAWLVQAEGPGSGEKLKDELVFAMLDRTRARQRCKNNPRGACKCNDPVGSVETRSRHALRSEPKNHPTFDHKRYTFPTIRARL